MLPVMRERLIQRKRPLDRRRRPGAQVLRWRFEVDFHHNVLAGPLAPTSDLLWPEPTHIEIAGVRMAALRPAVCECTRNSSVVTDAQSRLRRGRESDSRRPRP